METVAWDGRTTPRPAVHPVRGAARGGVPVPLSILDLVTVSAGSTAVEAVRTSTELAGLAERLGYHRMWVAEQFGTLEALHPGRFDLGIGRAPGTGPAAMAALRRSPADFDQQLDELIGFLDGGPADGDPFAGVHAVPGPIQAGAAGGTGELSRPPVWILGSSERGARLAGRRGLPFALAYHLEPGNLATALRAYRDAFRPSATLAEPYAIVSVWVVAAETRRQAERLMRSVGLGVLRMTQGVPSLVPSPEEAERYPYTDGDEEIIRSALRHVIHGEPAEVRTRLTRLAEVSQADELMLVTHVHGHQARLRSYELVANACQMSYAEAAR